VELSVEGKPEYSFFGVYDGHGGKMVAENSAKLTGLLAKIKAAPSWAQVDSSPEKLKEAIVTGFVKQDEELRAVRPPWGQGACAPRRRARAPAPPHHHHHHRPSRTHHARTTPLPLPLPPTPLPH
jgi:hypothetical protein